jgi:hypothetical protein
VYLCGLEQISCGFSVSARKWKGAQEKLGERQGHKVLHVRVTQDQKQQNLDTRKKRLTIRPPKKQPNKDTRKKQNKDTHKKRAKKERNSGELYKQLMEEVGDKRLPC